MQPRRRFSVIAILALIVGGTVVGGVAGYLLLQRAGIGVNPSPGSSATQPASMASQPLASEATLIPSPSNQPSESPRPRDGWTAVVVAEDNPYATVVDVYDAGDILVAFGQADRDLLGVWLSTDGSSWTAADSSPVPPDGYGGRIVDVLHPSGGGLLALAELGLPEGSEPLGTAMYASQDGNEWRPVGDVPAGVRLAALATDGDLLFAGGSSGIWYSDDSGATWLQSADAEALGGQVVDIGEHDGGLLAVGFSGTIETQAPVLWASIDDGQAWERTSLGTSGAATDVAATPDGSPVVLGSIEEDAVAWRMDAGQWRSEVLGACCLRDVATTPSGIVGVAIPYNGDEPYVIGSSDGLSWQIDHPGTSPLLGIAWSDRAGLLATSDAGEVVLGPTPYP